MNLELDKIQMNGGTQTRAYMDSGNIDEYAELMKSGVVFPPVQVTYDGESYWLTDGFHRVSAAKKAGLTEIAVEVSPGTLQDAQWRSYAANKDHGIRRSRSDTQRAIEAALLHPSGATMSDRQIAEYVGCSAPTVGSIRARLVATGKLLQSNERVGKDGRTINTEKIGLKHQVEQWKKLILAPWLAKKPKGADLVLIHNGDKYLHIVTDAYTPAPLLKQRYHMNYAHFAPRGAAYDAGAYGVLVDKGYVELFERDGLNVYIEEYKDLDEGMQRGAKAAFNTRSYGNQLNTFVQVDPQLRPGDLVARKEMSAYSRGVYVGEVVGVSASFIHARRPGSESQEIWFGGELYPVETAWMLTPGNVHWLNYGQVSRASSWLECYQQTKRFYAPEFILVACCDTAFIAVGDDALKLDELLNRETPIGVLSHHEETGPVFITFDSEALKAVARSVVMVGFRIDYEPLRKFYSSVIAVTAQVATPELTPLPATKPGPARNPREFRLMSIWHSLKHIAAELDEIAPEDDDEIAAVYVPLEVVFNIIGGALGIEQPSLYEQGELQ